VQHLEPQGNQANLDPEPVWDDPRERPRTGATIIRRRQGRLDLETFAPLVEQYTGMMLAEATAVCLHGRGIFLDNVETAAAAALAQAMLAQGADCFTIPAADLVPQVPAHYVHSARLTDADLTLTDEAGHAASAPWEKVVVIGMGQLPVVTVTERQRTWGETMNQPIGLGGIVLGTAGLPGIIVGGAAGMGAQPTQKHTDMHTVVDLIFLHPLRRMRIDVRDFDYSILGQLMQPNTFANFRVFLGDLLAAAPHARTNFDRTLIHATGDMPLTRYQPHEFDELTHWMVNLLRFGG
jgi:hypothetical protein